MANSTTQIFVHIIIAIHAKDNLADQSFSTGIEKVIAKTVAQNHGKLFAVHCSADHAHLLVGFSPLMSVASLVADIKVQTSAWVNISGHVAGKFAWQDGFGSFSHSRSQLDDVAKYILNQKEFHAKKSFREEYMSILQKHEIDGASTQLFDWYE